MGGHIQPQYLIHCKLQFHFKRVRMNRPVLETPDSNLNVIDLSTSVSTQLHRRNTSEMLYGKKRLPFGNP